MPTTWNPSDILRGTLSNGNLTFSGAANQGGVRSTTSKSTEKVHFEVTVNTNAASDTGVGISIGGASLSSLASNAQSGVIAFTDFSSGAIWFNTSATGSALGNASNGDIIAVEIDASNKLYWAARNAGNWNGSALADPATGTGGISFSALTGPFFATLTNSTTTVLTGNFGASTFSRTVSSGFGPWDPGPSFDDTLTSSDNFDSTLVSIGSLIDTVATSDSHINGEHGELIDTLSTSDSFSGTWTGTPTPFFSGLIREALGSGGSSVDITFSGLTRASLFAANPLLNFAGMIRETLVSVSARFINIKTPPGTSTVIATAFGQIPIFPTLPESFPIKVSTVMDTTIGTTKSLREMRVAQQQYPLWDIEILFEELRDQTQNQTVYVPFSGYQQYMDLVQQWLMMYGQTNVFGFDCPWDNSRDNQLIGVGDGRNYLFTIFRTWGTGANATTAPIGLVNQVFEVRVNNVVIDPSHYSASRDKISFIDSDGFIYPPGNGLDITMTFSYYYLCRFTEDEQDFEEFAKDRWIVSSLKFRAVILP